MRFNRLYLWLVGFLQKVRRKVHRLCGREQFDEVELVYLQLSGELENKVMIDVGAHYGTAFAPFLLKGWRVIAFEPDQVNLDALNKRMKGIPIFAKDNLTIIQKAVTLKDGDRLDFYRSSESSGISGLIPFRNSHQVGQVAETITLKTALEEHGCDKAGFLKVDTEGFDLFVLQSFPWAEKEAPEVIVCEFEDQKTSHVGYVHQHLGQFLLDKGYHVLISEWEPIVRYGIQHKWSSMKRYPCTLESPNGWGNFIAVKNPRFLDKLIQSV